MTPQQEAYAARYGTRVAPKLVNSLWQYYNNPGTTGAAAGAEAGTAGASAFGENGVGMTAGGWASVAAPLVMAYLKYQAGSGVNEPLARRRETVGAAKMFKDLIDGLNPSATETYDYGLSPKAWKPSLDGGPSTEIDENNKWGLGDLWHLMHKYGSGHSQQGGTGNSGYNDIDIDKNLMGSTGLDARQLAEKLGLGEMPDWSKQTYDTWNASFNKEPVFMDSVDSMTGERKSQMMSPYEQQKAQMASEEEELKKRGVVMMGGT